MKRPETNIGKALRAAGAADERGAGERALLSQILAEQRRTNDLLREISNRLIQP